MGEKKEGFYLKDTKETELTELGNKKTKLVRRRDKKDESIGLLDIGFKLLWMTMLATSY